MATIRDIIESRLADTQAKLAADENTFIQPSADPQEEPAEEQAKVAERVDPEALRGLASMLDDEVGALPDEAEKEASAVAMAAAMLDEEGADEEPQGQSKEAISRGASSALHNVGAGLLGLGAVGDAAAGRIPYAIAQGAGAAGLVRRNRRLAREHRNKRIAMGLGGGAVGGAAIGAGALAMQKKESGIASTVRKGMRAGAEKGRRLDMEEGLEQSQRQGMSRGLGYAGGAAAGGGAAYAGATASSQDKEAAAPFVRRSTYNKALSDLAKKNDALAQAQAKPSGKRRAAKVLAGGAAVGGAAGAGHAMGRRKGVESERSKDPHQIRTAYSYGVRRGYQAGASRGSQKTSGIASTLTGVAQKVKGSLGEADKLVGEAGQAMTGQLAKERQAVNKAVGYGVPVALIGGGALAGVQAN